MNINKCTRAIMWGGILSFTCHTVSATIVSGAVTGGQSLTQGGTFVKLTVPFTNSDPDNTVGNDTFEDPNLYGFDEGQNIDISVDLAVDILADGMGGSSGSGIVPMGSTVASHYIFFDPAATTGGTTQVGTVSFDSDIFGIITSTSNLAASDFLINTGVTYLNPTLRGLESGDSAIRLDEASLPVSRHWTILFMCGLSTVAVSMARYWAIEHIFVLAHEGPFFFSSLPASS